MLLMERLEWVSWPGTSITTSILVGVSMYVLRSWLLWQTPKKTRSLVWLVLRAWSLGDSWIAIYVRTVFFSLNTRLNTEGVYPLGHSSMCKWFLWKIEERRIGQDLSSHSYIYSIYLLAVLITQYDILVPLQILEIGLGDPERSLLVYLYRGLDILRNAPIVRM